MQNRSVASISPPTWHNAQPGRKPDPARAEPQPRPLIPSPHTQDALQGAVGGLAEGLVHLLGKGLLLHLHHQVHHRHGGGGHAQGHACGRGKKSARSGLGGSAERSRSRWGAPAAPVGSLQAKGGHPRHSVPWLCGRAHRSACPSSGAAPGPQPWRHQWWWARCSGRRHGRGACSGGVAGMEVVSHSNAQLRAVARIRSVGSARTQAALCLLPGRGRARVLTGRGGRHPAGAGRRCRSGWWSWCP